MEWHSTIRAKSENISSFTSVIAWLKNLAVTNTFFCHKVAKKQHHFILHCSQKSLYSSLAVDSNNETAGTSECVKYIQFAAGFYVWFLCLGSKGDPGLTADRGLPGLAGPTGPSGDKGRPGIPGLNGLDGEPRVLQILNDNRVLLS